MRDPDASDIIVEQLLDLFIERLSFCLVGVNRRFVEQAGDFLVCVPTLARIGFLNLIRGA